MVRKKEQKDGLLEHNFDILKHDKTFLFLLFAGLFVAYSFIFGLWKIPLIEFGINRESTVGILDYLYLFATSALISAFVVLWRHERKSQIQSNTAVGIVGGGSAALLAGVCPVCQSIGLVAFGSTFLNIPTIFLTPYLGIVKFLSLGMLVLAVYLKADSVHTETCKACATFGRKNLNRNGRAT